MFQMMNGDGYFIAILNVAPLVHYLVGRDYNSQVLERREFEISRKTVAIFYSVLPKNVITI